MNESPEKIPGVVEGIYVAAARGEVMRRVAGVRAVTGRGLEGDRYFDGRGSFSKWPGGGRALSLIEGEVIDDIARDHGISLDDGRSRRNLVTRGVRLQGLIGRWFSIGEAVFFGDRACAPCRYLERLVAPGLYEVIKGRGGLRADVLRDGVVREGDPVVAFDQRPSFLTAVPRPRAGRWGRRVIPG